VGASEKSASGGAYKPHIILQDDEICYDDCQIKTEITMVLHVLAGCGSFMAGLATIAKEKGNEVVVYDKKYQSPMLDQLEDHAIEMRHGYDHPLPQPGEEVIVGNAISRGVPMLEGMLSARIPFMSGPAWLAQSVLKSCKTIAVSGTHGKTTTTSLFAWVLEVSKKAPGFLVGGIPNNFNTSARLGGGQWFVVEADEYDTSFADKRPKFFHYPADLLIINNLEFDHADIYRDLEDIVKQFRYYLRTLVPGSKIIYPKSSEVIDQLVKEAGWCTAYPTHATNEGQPWHMRPLSADWSRFEIVDGKGVAHTVCWDLFGKHNAGNALTVMCGAVALGLDEEMVVAALCSFQGVRKRMQKIGQSADGKEVWDDYAHHPTAVRKVIAACRKRFKEGRLVICFQLCNFTQAQGVMWQELVDASQDCDLVLLVDQGDKFPYQQFKKAHSKPVEIISAQTATESMQRILAPGDKIITCSSRDCSVIHEKMLPEMV
jgi:UDP-N-acetylmuramate: L-alanyl-gamma-D-glutamyl-meso-diaminopimelate ligase